MKIRNILNNIIRNIGHFNDVRLGICNDINIIEVCWIRIITDQRKSHFNCLWSVLNAPLSNRLLERFSEFYQRLINFTRSHTGLPAML